MELLTTGQAAARMGVSVDTIRAYLDRGLLSGITLPSGHRRIDAQQVDDLAVRRRPVSANVAVVQAAP